jgi:hypothetical protein
VASGLVAVPILLPIFPLVSWVPAHC